MLSIKLFLFTALMTCAIFGWFAFGGSMKIWAADESEIILTLVNEERKRVGISPLRWNDKLAKAANLKAKNMADLGYWSHYTPDGKTPWIFITSAGYAYKSAGENLARGFSADEKMVNAWMNSPAHKANIVSDRFTDTGIGVTPVTLGDWNTKLVVQMFASPAE